MVKGFPVYLGLLLSVLFLAGQSANATVCDVNDLTVSTACQQGTTNNDTLNPSLQVNTDVMFGFQDWLFAEKWDQSANSITDSNIDLGLNISGGADFDILGSWSVITNIWDLYGDVMIVMKGGNGSLERNYFGYLIAHDVVSGNYMSPFSNPNNGNAMGVSHWSLYVRTARVPEPAPLALLGFGLLGFGLMRRRRR